MKYTELKAAGAVVNTVSANDLFMICYTPETNPRSRVVQFDDLVSSLNRIEANAIPIMTESTPANSSITVARSVMFHDNDYLYIAVDTNLLKRVALTAF
jgi:hypothetical protein